MNAATSSTVVSHVDELGRWPRNRRDRGLRRHLARDGGDQIMFGQLGQGCDSTSSVPAPVATALVPLRSASSSGATLTTDPSSSSATVMCCSGHVTRVVSTRAPVAGPKVTAELGRAAASQRGKSASRIDRIAVSSSSTASHNRLLALRAAALRARVQRETHAGDAIDDAVAHRDGDPIAIFEHLDMAQSHLVARIKHRDRALGGEGPHHRDVFGGETSHRRGDWRSSGFRGSRLVRAAAGTAPGRCRWARSAVDALADR